MTQDQKFKKWMEALRSGDYKQVQCTLMGKTPDGEIGYCCLGVYNDLFKVGEMQVEVEHDDYGYEVLEEGPTETYAAIRKDFNEGVFETVVVDTGIEMNDNGKSFLEIADELEKLWESKT